MIANVCVKVAVNDQMIYFLYLFIKKNNNKKIKQKEKKKLKENPVSLVMENFKKSLLI